MPRHKHQNGKAAEHPQADDSGEDLITDDTTETFADLMLKNDNFGIADFVKKNKLEKILYFANKLDVRPQKLSVILGMSEETLKLRPTPHAWEGGKRPPEPTPPALDDFGTLLAYLLQTSSYDVARLKQLWKDSGEYGAPKESGDRTPPPWSVQGLESYLLSHKRAGLSEAVLWIGRHLGATAESRPEKQVR